MDISCYRQGHWRSVCADRVHTRRGLEPPPHIHTKEDELYYLLEGEMQFIAGDAEHVLSPGQSIFLPKNIPHQFRVLSSEAGFLVEVSPAGLKRMLIALSRPAETLTLPLMPPDRLRPSSPKTEGPSADLWHNRD